MGNSDNAPSGFARVRSKLNDALYDSQMTPDFVTHYHLGDREPFLNLSDLDDAKADEVMAELILLGKEGVHSRVFGKKYLAIRRRVEERLLESFVETGGQPERTVPHYFVLGESAWFRGLAENMREFRLAISALPYEQTSITIPDSFTAMEIGPEFGLPLEPRPYHGHVYRLDEVEDLVTRYGTFETEAERNYSGYERRENEHFIEVQLWSDQPILDAKVRKTTRR
jgi:hypothetical protein